MPPLAPAHLEICPPERGALTQRAKTNTRTHTRNAARSTDSSLRLEDACILSPLQVEAACTARRHGAMNAWKWAITLILTTLALSLLQRAAQAVALQW